MVQRETQRNHPFGVLGVPYFDTPKNRSPACEGKLFLGKKMCRDGESYVLDACKSSKSTLPSSTRSDEVTGCPILSGRCGQPFFCKHGMNRFWSAETIMAKKRFLHKLGLVVPCLQLGSGILLGQPSALRYAAPSVPILISRQVWDF